MDRSHEGCQQKQHNTANAEDQGHQQAKKLPAVGLLQGKEVGLSEALQLVCELEKVAELTTQRRDQRHGKEHTEMGVALTGRVG